MKHLFAIAVLLLVACGQASDERELTQLVKDLNAALVKTDIAFLERVLNGLAALVRRESFAQSSLVMASTL